MEQKPRHVVAALFVNWDLRKVLMTLRLPTAKRPNMWEYPGGKVESSDASDDAALDREMLEELKKNITILIHTMAYCHVPFEGGGATIRLSLCRFIGDEPPVPAASQEIRWVDPYDAIQFLPCVPSTYLFYPHVMRALTLGPAIEEGRMLYGLR